MKFVQISDLHVGGLFKQEAFNTLVEEVYEFKSEKENVVILSLDTALPDRDEGEVGDSQNLWINEVLKTYDNKVIKIVAMHHHLIAIPDTGFTNLVGILDSGDALRILTENSVSLVLCGHKHRPWLWNLGNLKIAYAGTSSSWRYRGIFEDTYNIIEIKEKNINIDIKMVGGRRFPISELVEKYEPEKRLPFSK